MRRRVVLGLSCASVFATAYHLDAQDLRLVRPKTPHAGVVATPQPPARGNAEIVLEPVVKAGSPRTYQVISVSVPETVSTDSAVVADIIPIGGFSVLGRTRILLTPSAATRKITLTIVIPARARAGLARAAEVRFHVGRNLDVIVPIDIRVAEVRKLTLRTSTVAIVTHAGGVASVPFTIMNDGNTTQKLRITIALPREWHSPNLRKTGIVVEPGRTFEARMQVKIPERSATGSSFFPMAMLDSVGPLGSAQIAVEILDALQASLSMGPQVVAAVSAVTGAGATEVIDLAVRGPIYDSVRIEGRMAYTPKGTSFANPTLARLGIYQGVSYLVLSSPSSSLQLGAAGLSLSELTGERLYGHGAVLETSRDRWSFAGIAANSERATSSGGSQPLLGARGEVRAGAVRFFSSVSHLVGGEEVERRLDAFGAGTSFPLPYNGLFRAELARREYAGGHDLGWATAFERTVNRNSARLAYSHAPGGTGAFARSADEITTNVSQQLTQRASISAAGWRVSDPTQVFRSVQSDGWSLRPEYRVLPSTTIAVEAGAYGFDAVHRDPSVVATSFGTHDHRLGLSVTSSVQTVHLNGSVSFGEVTRSVTTRSRGRIEDRTPRIVWTGVATIGSERGSLQLNANIDENRDKTGAVHRIGTIGVRADQVRAPLLFNAVRISAEAQTLTGYGKKSEFLVRGNLDIPVGAQFKLKVGAERNPSLFAASNPRSWMYTARIERALRMPMLRAPGTTGFVYRDLNGNGRRDRGEPGVSNAVVHRGSITAVTGVDGRYRLAGDRTETAQLDDGSIPDGWIVVRAGGPDFGLTAAAVASIDFIVAPSPALRDARIDLSSARIIARDTRGRDWIARMSGPATATFDALPPADYDLEFDFSGVAERLTVRGPVPRLHLPADGRITMTVTLEPRQLKLWTSEAESSGMPRQ